MSGKFEPHQEDSQKRGGGALPAVLLILLLLAAAAAAAFFLLPKRQSPQPTEEPTVPTQAATTQHVTQAPTTEPATEAPTTEPAPVYTNPLTGEVLEEPLTKRLYAVSINNLPDAVPHYGINKADMFLEMFVNGSIIRGLALYSDVTDVPAIGSVRSTRYMFNDLCIHYDAITVHAGGSEWVLANVRERGVDGFNIDTPDKTDYSFRDQDRVKAGYGWEHVLFAKGEGLEAKALEKGFRVDQDPEKDYCLRFTDDGTPADGEDANTVSLTFTFRSSKKDTSMVYDESLGKYVYNQYGKSMVDGETGEPEAFQNVFILMTNVTMNAHGYHEADLVTGGEGYYACGGKIIPITWGSDSEDSPLWFRTMDGEPLLMGVGNSYVAIAPVGSPVSYE